jgi:WD40 repeat protein
MQSDTMRAMVASVGYSVELESHEGHDAHSMHPKLYSALYYAHKYLNRTRTYNYDKLSNKPLYAMAYNPNNKTLYMSYGVDGLRSMHFNKNLDDEGFDFPTIDSVAIETHQPIHNLNITENNSVILSSDEFVFNVHLNNNEATKHIISNGVKIINVIPFQSEDEYLVLTSTKQIYRFNSLDGTFTLLKGIKDASHIAYIKRLNILIYVATDNQLHLVNYNKDIATSWGVRPGLSKLIIKDYGDKIYIVYGYLNGVIRVGITDAIELNAHDDKASRSPRKARMLQFILSSNTHKGFITDIDFAESIHTMVAASGDGTASIWDLEDWVHRQTDYLPILLDDHEGWVTSCAINSADNIVFTGTKSGVIKFWPLDPAFFADKICEKLNGRSSSEREWGIYIGNEVPFKNQICK